MLSARRPIAAPPPSLAVAAPPPSLPTRPSSGASVVPIQPRPPAFLSTPTRPVIIEEDIVDYLVKVPPEQRWRILSRVALATRDEPPQPSAADVAAAAEPRADTIAPAPERRTLDLVPEPADSRPVMEPRAAEPSEAKRESRVPPPSTAPAPPSRGMLHTLRPAPGSSAPPPYAPVAAPAIAPAPPPPRTDSPAVEHAEELFQAMHALSLFESAPAGARFCLEVALSTFPCVAGLVHLLDPAARELFVVQAEGPRADTLVGTRTPLADSLVFKAARAAKPLVLAYGDDTRNAESHSSKCARHAFFDPWSVVVAPVIVAGKLVGLIELIDPVDGKPFDELSQSALAYIAERLGRFLAEHAG